MNLIGTGISKEYKAQYMLDAIPSGYVIKSVEDFRDFLIYSSKTYHDWVFRIEREYHWLVKEDEYHRTDLKRGNLVYTKIYENGKSTNLGIPHEHSILEIGLRPLIKYIKKGKTEVVYNSKFELKGQLAISNITNIELVDKRKISIVKSYTKTKRGTDVPIYYINGAEYNGQEYKKHMKTIKECYDNKFRPKF